MAGPHGPWPMAHGPWAMGHGQGWPLAGTGSKPPLLGPPTVGVRPTKIDPVGWRSSGAWLSDTDWRRGASGLCVIICNERIDVCG
jgi:hypothetical protein